MPRMLKPERGEKGDKGVRTKHRVRIRRRIYEPLAIDKNKILTEAFSPSHLRTLGNNRNLNTE